MAGASIVVSDASAEHHRTGAATLFADLSFFCLQKLPHRSQLIRDIEANGGRVVKNEKLADYVIADHVRKDVPAGSYSWTLITTAIANGALPDPAEHYAGPRPGAIRDVGSAAPGKATRTHFTHEEDKQLWRWVEQEKTRGGQEKGNDIYKRLEQLNPRHTFQSWRDRYLKKLMNNPPAGVQPTVPANAPPSPPTALDGENEEEEASTPPAKRRRVEIADARDQGPDHSEDQTEKVGTGEHEREETDVDLLMPHAADINNVVEDQWLSAWELWAEAYPHRSAQEWAKFWHEVARPQYQAQLRDKCDAERPSVRPSDIGENQRKRKRYFDIAPSHDENHLESGSPRPRSQHHSPPRSSDVGRSDHTPRAATAAALERQAPFAELLTSDENRAAGQQITNESLAAFDKSASRAGLVEASSAGEDLIKLLTYGNNQLYDRPYISDELEAENLQSPEVQQRPTEDGIGAPMREDDVGSDFESQLSGGTALTEANLAAQEAQHKVPLLRGADLPEDDANNDQSDFVKYLQQSLMPNHNQSKLSQDWEESESHRDARKARSIEDESGKDVDEVILSNLEWLSSPQRPQVTAMPSNVQAEDVENDAFAEENGLTAGSPLDASSTARPDAVARSGGLQAMNMEPSDDLDQEVDLSVAFPEVGGGFDPSSDRDSTPAMAEEEALDLGDYYDEVDDPNPHEYDTPRKASQFIEISSTSIPTSPLPDSPGSQDGTRNRQRARPLETQDFYNAETQQADLTMPLPLDTDDEDGDEDEEDDQTAHDSTETMEQYASSQAMRADSPPADLGSEDESERLESWMTTMKVRGHNESAIIEAIKCTSLQLDLAEFVLMHVKGGKGIPTDVPGVWSEDEDEQLEGGNAKAIRLLEKKHGWDACRARLNYLEQYRDTD
ncbi:hypothetical protein CBER1_01910 [Cercospora berteroae]|uniref:DNA-binding protein RAP1 n=1 Tax=Cercospora berteroae TaxID=357750 RepID=A0A2S6BQ11_9PEZI|nr:hypothetical protein CBER1_01910 [Cercospora berteroae]